MQPAEANTNKSDVRVPSSDTELQSPKPQRELQSPSIQSVPSPISNNDDEVYVYIYLPLPLNYPPSTLIFQISLLFCHKTTGDNTVFSFSRRPRGRALKRRRRKRKRMKVVTGRGKKIAKMIMVKPLILALPTSYPFAIKVKSVVFATWYCKEKSEAFSFTEFDWWLSYGSDLTRINT